MKRSHLGGSGEEVRVDRAFIEHLPHAGLCVKYFTNFLPTAPRPPPCDPSITETLQGSVSSPVK